MSFCTNYGFYVEIIYSIGKTSEITMSQSKEKGHKNIHVIMKKAI